MSSTRWDYEATLGPASARGPAAPPTPRSFGFTVGGVLALLALAPLRHGQSPRRLLLGVALVLVSLAATRPSLLAVPNRLWSGLGDVLHRIVSPVVLGVIFFLVVTPIGILRRLRGHDPLGLRLKPSRSTYWIERDAESGDLRRQF